MHAHYRRLLHFRNENRGHAASASICRTSIMEQSLVALKKKKKKKEKKEKSREKLYILQRAVYCANLYQSVLSNCRV